MDVYTLEDALPAGVEPARLLGGKAAGLVTMARELGLPVPPFFTVTTEVCRRFLAGGWPEGLDAAIRAALAKLEAATGRTFGGGDHPLLVSVRSGAPVSMPGMMDTLLNVGMAPEVVAALERETGDPRFAADTWLRFVRGYASIVLGVPEDQASHAAMHDGSIAGLRAAADRVAALAERFGGIPGDPFAQVREAVRAVFRSWECDRARVFREREGIAADLGTAATVQAMVFGNLDARSGTGVAFTRDPSTGARGAFGDYLACAQGEDVVAGTHAVSGLDALARDLPETYRELLAHLQRLERHYRDMCDVEFTVMSGRLYILQTRVGRRSPLAAVRIAVDMAEDPDFPLTRREAVERVGTETLQQLAKLGTVDPAAEPIGEGLPVSPGVGAGVLCCDADRAAALAAAGTSVVLARPETSPADVHGMVAASALVTTTGGVVSHAAVVARGWAIPAICSLRDAVVEADALVVRGRRIPEGEPVTVDGTRGLLFAGDCRVDGAADLPELRTLRQWAAELAESGTGDGPAPAGARPVDRYAVLRALGLKGLAAAERIAAVLEADPAAVEALLREAAAEGLARETPRGFALLPAGRETVLAALDAERAGLDAAAIDAVFERFDALDREFKALVSGWQQASPAEAESAWARAVAALESVHERLQPVLAEASALVPRLAPAPRRFAAALAAVRAGDQSMLASPLKESYHTAWFELHEELIALSGRQRTE
ncbi:pyruvate, phosphate dikinase [Tepidiforma sp.]|uniref:pyruvate, phosphate dikinase n=1 Tax=Tepidiforma sp. TaxID=2682230 RepID=UPI002ADE2AE0|nr:pyruvate, phosphate dikinase [Tepidiforma sp.]